jgi:hypothetical protein
MDVVRLLLKTRLRAGQQCDSEASFSVLVCIRHTSSPTIAQQVLVNSEICSKVDFVGRKTGWRFAPPHRLGTAGQRIWPRHIQELSLMHMRRLILHRCRSSKTMAAIYMFCHCAVPRSSWTEALVTNCRCTNEGWRRKGPFVAKTLASSLANHGRNPPLRPRHPQLHSDISISLEYELRDNKAPLLQSALVSDSDRAM